MKRFLYFALLIAGCISIFNVVCKNIKNEQILSMIRLDNLAYSEVTIIPAKDNADNPRSCRTTKVVQVSIGNGQFEYKTISVSGMENSCRHKANATCNAYACYAN